MKPEKIIMGIGVIAIAALLLLPISVNAKSCEQAIAGLEGEDSGDGKEAKHPQDDAQGQYVHCVYSRETNQPDPYGGGMVWNIRLAISFNWGSSWTYFEWVDLNVSVHQDYPDVDIYFDYPEDEWKVLVVWQERTVEGGPWEIKMKVRSGLSSGGTWSNTMTVSQEDDQYDNIYPKVAGCSIQGCELPEPNPPDDPDSWWNVVWQRYYSTGTYGVKLRVSTYLNQWSSIHDIGVPQDSTEEYKHPAVSCITYGEGRYGWEDVHIAYKLMFWDGDSMGSIHYEGGRIPWNSNTYPTPLTYGPISVSGYYTDYLLDYPDIWAYGPATPSGEVHVVWMENSQVMYNINDHGGADNYWLTAASVVSPNGGSGSLRCVAIKVDNSQCSVVWTANAEIIFNKINKISGSWQNWSDREPYEEIWTTNENVDIFVDVSISSLYEPPGTIYSHVVWQRDTVTVWYARDP